MEGSRTVLAKLAPRTISVSMRVASSPLRIPFFRFSGSAHCMVRMSSVTHTQRSCGGPLREYFMKMLPALSMRDAMKRSAVISPIR